MGLYNKYILPKVVDWACKQRPTRRQREKVIPLATGHVLEVGIGSGLNIPFYHPDQVRHLTGIDPSTEIWDENKVDTNKLPFDFDFVKAFAENLPVGTNTIDSAVITYTLCSIPKAHLALEEIRRVLKPGGKLIFCEHGKAPDKNVLQWQNFINPLWKRVGGGCNLNKDIPKIIGTNGFRINALETMYIPGWKPASYNYWGTATPS